MCEERRMPRPQAQHRRRRCHAEHGHLRRRSHLSGGLSHRRRRDRPCASAADHRRSRGCRGRSRRHGFRRRRRPGPRPCEPADAPADARADDAPADAPADARADDAPADAPPNLFPDGPADALPDAGAASGQPDDIADAVADALRRLFELGLPRLEGQAARLQMDREEGNQALRVPSVAYRSCGGGGRGVERSLRHDTRGADDYLTFGSQAIPRSGPTAFSLLTLAASRVDGASHPCTRARKATLRDERGLSRPPSFLFPAH